MRRYNTTKSFFETLRLCSFDELINLTIHTKTNEFSKKYDVYLMVVNNEINETLLIVTKENPKVYFNFMLDSFKPSMTEVEKQVDIWLYETNLLGLTNKTLIALYQYWFSIEQRRVIFDVDDIAELYPSAWKLYCETKDEDVLYNNNSFVFYKDTVAFQTVSRMIDDGDEYDNFMEDSFGIGGYYTKPTKILNRKINEFRWNIIKSLKR